MIMKISYDSKDWYVDILKFSLSWWHSKIQFDMILNISYDSEDWYVDILKISMS